MEIKYLYHSGMAFITESHALIVDYYAPQEMHALLQQHIEALLHSGKKLYVLASHRHADHFSPEILTWDSPSRPITYILSEDIRPLIASVPPHTVFLKESACYCDERVWIRAFGSTDVGVSFLIRTDGLTLFHAGDLNNWHWKEESTPEEVREEEEKYLRQVDIIRREAPQVDVACLPVDPRLGADYRLGAWQWIQRIRTRWLIPIHFSAGSLEDAHRMAPLAESCHTACWQIQKEGDSLFIERKNEL